MDKLLDWLQALCIAAVLSLGCGVAAASYHVDVNSADDAMLQTISGIGPATAQAIIKARDAHGPFGSAEELVRRVRRVGAKSVAKWQARGLTFGCATADVRCAPVAVSAP